MHPTADTKVVKFLQWLGAPPELRRYTAQLPLAILVPKERLIMAKMTTCLFNGELISIDEGSVPTRYCQKARCRCSVLWV